MTIRTRLYALVRVVTNEARQNPEFAQQLRSVLEPPAKKRERKVSSTRRRANRRPPAVLDPIALAQKGENVLRTELESLSLDQLKDIVAEYGMDPKRLVMKWKTSGRVIETIVEISISRAHKGEAFRS